MNGARAVSRLPVEGLAVSVNGRGHAGLGAFGVFVGREEAEHDDGRRGRERRGDDKAYPHRLGEGVAGRGEQVGGGILWELSGVLCWRHRLSFQRWSAPWLGGN